MKQHDYNVLMSASGIKILQFLTKNEATTLSEIETALEIGHTWCSHVIEIFRVDKIVTKKKQGRENIIYITSKGMMIGKSYNHAEVLLK